MPLKAKIDKLSEVTEEHQGLYRELPDNGGYVLDVIESSGYAVENISGLRSTLQTQKRDIQSLRDQLTLFDGVDGNTLQSDLKELEKLRSLDPTALAKEQAGALIKQTEEKYENIITDLKKVNGQQSSVISDLLIDTHAQEVLSSVGGATKLLLPHIKSQCEVVTNDDGVTVVQVVDHNGNPRIAIADGKTRDFTIEDLVKEMKNDPVYMPAFNAKGKGGAGGPSDHHHPSDNGEARVIHDGGHESISHNLEDIASGEAVVETA